MGMYRSSNGSLAYKKFLNMGRIFYKILNLGPNFLTDMTRAQINLWKMGLKNGPILKKNP